MNFTQTESNNELAEEYENPSAQFQEAELRDGTRFSWNIWQTTITKNDTVPIACLYNIKQQCPQINYEPINCSKCQSALHCWAYMDAGSNTWTCSFCQSRNNLPRDINFESLDEINQGLTTVEYISAKTSAFPPVFMFLIDTSTYDQERHELMINVIQTAINLLPDDAMVGLITFGTNVNVHSFTNEPLKTIYQFSGDFVYSKKNIRGMEDLRMFLVKKSEKLDELLKTIKNLNKDPFPILDGNKPNRCTGSAISFATSFLEGPFIDNPVKFMLFTQGPCTYGPGMTSLKEITTEEKVDLVKAKLFYDEQAKRLNDLGHSFDIFGMTIADIGFEEMENVVTQSGGNIVLAQDFEERIIVKTLERLFKPVEDAEYLNFGFNAKMIVRTTPNITIKNISGTGKSTGGRWKAGCIDETNNLTLLFEPNEKSKPNEYAYVQIKTTYIRSDRVFVTRVTTFAKMFSNNKQQIIESFDEEAACITQSRFYSRLPYENIFDLETAIDKHLIRFAKKYATWERNNPDSLTMPHTMSYYLNFMFFFRRSFVIQKDGISLDESAYFKTLLNKLRPVDALKLIKPQLLVYTCQGEVIPSELSTEVMQDDVMLILDSFHNVLQWQGLNISNWIKENVQNDPGYEFFKNALDIIDADCRELLSNRTPAPQFKKTAAGKSQERILMTYLCSSGGVANKTNKIDFYKFYSALCKHIVASD